MVGRCQEEHGTCETVNTRFRPWLLGSSPLNVSSVHSWFGSGIVVRWVQAGSHLRRTDTCITQPKAQGLFRSCDESKEEEEEEEEEEGLVPH